MITNTQSGTNIHEIAAGIYRINTPAPLPDGSVFSFNQYLIADEAPMLFQRASESCSRSSAKRSAPCCPWSA